MGCVFNDLYRLKGDTGLITYLATSLGMRSIHKMLSNFEGKQNLHELKECTITVYQPFCKLIATYEQPFARYKL